jgi:hypothetical protein
MPVTIAILLLRSSLLSHFYGAPSKIQPITLCYIAVVTHNHENGPGGI